MTKLSLEERFMRHVAKQPGDDGCWLWTASRFKNTDYGQIRVETADGGWTAGYAHRVAHELFIGPVPGDIEVCHTCDVHSCVRPSHLFLGTHMANMTDMGYKNRGRKGQLPYGVFRSGSGFRAQVRINGSRFCSLTVATIEHAHRLAVEAKARALNAPTA